MRRRCTRRPGARATLSLRAQTGSATTRARACSNIFYLLSSIVQNYPSDLFSAFYPLTRAKIEKTAQAILDARKIYPDSSFADLYDETTMPPELRKAHRENDRAVLKAYGLPSDATEETIVAHLMGLYTEKVAEVERREAVEAAVRKALEDVRIFGSVR